METRKADKESGSPPEPGAAPGAAGRVPARPTDMDLSVVPAGGEGGRGSHDVDGRDGRAGADIDNLEAGTGGPANAGNSDTCAAPGVQHARGDNEQAAGPAQAAGRGEEEWRAGEGEGTNSVPAQSCLPESLLNKDESMMALEREIDHLVCLLCLRFT